VNYAIETETGVLRSNLKKTFCNVLINTNILLLSTNKYTVGQGWAIIIARGPLWEGHI